jgi:NADH dehydrogenase FAD-containing subunit
MSVKEIKVLNLERGEHEEVRPAAILSNQAVIPFGMMVWSTGVKSLDFIRDLELQHDRN